MKTLRMFLEESNYVYLYHGTHKDNVKSFMKNGLMANDSRTNEKRGVAWLSQRADVAFAYAVMGGETNYVQSKKPKDVPDKDRALIVFKIPRKWFDDNVLRIKNGSIPEVSFNKGIPAKFVDDIIIGNRQKVYSFPETKI